MNLRIDMNICRVCLKPGQGTSIFTGDTAEIFQFTTLLQVIFYFNVAFDAVDFGSIHCALSLRSLVCCSVRAPYQPIWSVDVCNTWKLSPFYRFAQAAKNDGLPQQLCAKCTSRMQAANEFRKQAEASDKHIRSFVTDVNKRFQQVTGNRQLPEAKCASQKKWAITTAWSRACATGDNDEEPDDELDAELQDIIQDEPDQTQYELIGAIDTQDSDTPRQQLLEILSSSGSPLQLLDGGDGDEDGYNNPQSIELYVVDEDADHSMCDDSEIFFEDEEELAADDDFDPELGNDDFDDEEYLEDEESGGEFEMVA